jgi:hypothetical protein
MSKKLQRAGAVEFHVIIDSSDWIQSTHQIRYKIDDSRSTQRDSSSAHFISVCSRARQLLKNQARRLKPKKQQQQQQQQQQ